MECIPTSAEAERLVLSFRNKPEACLEKKELISEGTFGFEAVVFFTYFLRPKSEKKVDL